MDLILQRLSVFNDLVILKSAFAEPARTIKADLPFDVPLSSLSGVFEEIGDVLLLFFRADGVLYVRVGEKGMELTDDIYSHHIAQDGHRRLTLHRGQDTLLDFSYPESDLGLYIPPNLVPFREDEDWDFGLFIHNVLLDSGRRARAWRGASS